MTDTEILDALDESLTRWRKKNAHRYDMQVGEVFFTTRGNDARSLRHCLIQAIEQQITDRIAAKLTNR